MNHIDDPRIEFYLQHQKVIEEWTGLRRDVRHAANDFFSSLVGDLEELAAEMEGEVAVVFEDPSYPYVGLCRPGWLGEIKPRVAIVFEWQRSTSTFTDGWRMVGVRVAMGEEGGKALTTGVRHALEPIRKAAGFPNSNNSYWPAWRHAVTAEGDWYWRDLTPYREALVGDIVTCWKAFSETIDEVVRATVTETEGTGGLSSGLSE